MSVINRIKDLCEKKNTTLIGLEREVSLGRGTIRNWDKNSPSMDKVQKVADYFHVSVDYLLGREPNYNFYDFQFSVNDSHLLTEEDKETLIKTFKDITNLYLNAKNTR